MSIKQEAKDEAITAWNARAHLQAPERDQPTWNTLAAEIAALQAENQRLRVEAKGCEYCTEGRGDITPYDLCRTYVENGMLKWDGVYKHQFDINFCPMCGRKLKGEKS